MSIVGPQGPTGDVGPTGPQGPAGATVNYFAGAVFGTGSVKAGVNFAARRLGTGAGSYRITTSTSANGAVLSAVVTPLTAGLNWKITAITPQSNGSSCVDVEFRNSAGTVTDTDFYFIIIQIT